jgi:hypothetical protein
LPSILTIVRPKSISADAGAMWRDRQAKIGQE